MKIFYYYHHCVNPKGIQQSKVRNQLSCLEQLVRLNVRLKT